MYPTTPGAVNSNYDGSGNPSFYGDALMYNAVLPSNGVYTLSVTGTQAGQYELFAVVPEPASLGLIGIGSVIVLIRRRQRTASSHVEMTPTYIS